MEGRLGWGVLAKDGSEDGAEEALQPHPCQSLPHTLQEEACFRVPAVGSHQPEAAHRGMASFAPTGLRTGQLELHAHQVPCAFLPLP